MRGNDITKRKINQFICFLWLIVFSGCTKPAVVDLSQTKPYDQYVGTQYRTIRDVVAYAIYEDLHRKRISFIELIPDIRISGPEVAFEKRIAKGQTITILSAWQERKLFYNDVYYVIALDNAGLPRDIQLRIELSRGNEGEGAELNPSVYERIRR